MAPPQKLSKALKNIVKKHSTSLKMNLCYVRHRIFEGTDWRKAAAASGPEPHISSVSQQQSSPPVVATAGRSTASTSEARQRPINNHASPSIAPPELVITPPTPPLQTPKEEASSSSQNLPILPPAPCHQPSSPPNPLDMAESEVFDTVSQLQQTLTSRDLSAVPSLLSRAKLHLLQLNALIPTPRTPQQHLLLAREVLELGALLSIRLTDADGFTRYFQQLQPFYALPPAVLPRERANASKITGLYLLLLLSQGDYAGFHTLLETLETAAQEARDSQADYGAKGLEDDEFIQYPIRLEQALMEGSYDKVWGETKRERVPSPEFGVFSNVSLT
jgi:hypothetical protein